MSEQENQRSEQYKRARDNFEEMSFEEKAAFLFEAVFATVTRSIERAGKVVSEELETVFRQAQEAAERASRKSRESRTEANGVGDKAAAEAESKESAPGDAEADSSAEDGNQKPEK